MGFTFATPTVVAGTVLVVEAVQSQNYVSGVSGWYLAANGDAEVYNLLARGALVTGVAPNRRIEINGTTYPNQIALFSGNAAEVSPALIRPELSGGNSGRLTLESPKLSPSGTIAFINLTGFTNASPSGAEFQADVMNIIGGVTKIKGVPVSIGDGSNFLEVRGWDVTPDTPGAVMTVSGAPVVTTTLAQTLTNKTLVSPTITGSGPITAGSLNLGLGSTVNDVQFGTGSFTVVAGGLGRINVPHTLGAVPTVAFVTFQNSTQVGTADLGLSTATTVVVNVRNITAAGALIADGTVVVCRYWFII